MIPTTVENVQRQMSQPKALAAGAILPHDRRIRIYAEDTVIVTPLEMAEARQLWRELQAKWDVEGRVAFLLGEEEDEVEPQQRAGWRRAQEDWNNCLAAASSKPGYGEPDEWVFEMDDDEEAWVPVGLDFEIDF